MKRLCLLGIAAGIAIAAMPTASQAQSYDPARFEIALKSAARSDRDFKSFYAARNHRPLWFGGRESASAADALLKLIESADLDGLDPGRYKPAAVRDAIERYGEASPKSLAKSEVLLSRILVAYARDLHRQRGIGTVYLDKELVPTPPTARSILGAAAAAPSLRNHIAAMKWMNPLYANLREGLAASHGAAPKAGRFWVPDGPSLKTGMSGERVWILRQRLGLIGGGTYDRSLFAEVRDFQAARGLPADGVAGSLTIAALNENPRDRERLIRVNLERARALPADPGRRYILVDAASARLWLYENGKVADTMKVVVGKPAEPTPMLAGLMHYALVNPYWNIPPDLARNRVAPEVLSKGVGYLKKMRYELLSDWSENPEVIDPKTIDWAAVAAGRKEVRIRQLPGKGNAMGKMKFMLPNDLGIYLHDTPDRELFAKADRHFSSGCVRLEDAPRLAKWLFGAPLVTRSGAPEQRVDLPEPVPVYITYLTTAPAGTGLVFRSDPYGRDRGATASRDRPSSYLARNR